MTRVNHELTELVIDYLESKYPNEFSATTMGGGGFDAITFNRGKGLARWFIMVGPSSANFFRPELQDAELSVSAARPEFFKRIDEYAKMYRESV